MKFTYSTNCMGPYGLWWYEENNIPFTTSIANNRFTNFKDVEQKHYEMWYGGRIDVYSGEHYPDELDLPIMNAESYGRFSDWLDKYSSSELKSFDELRELFENEEQFKLIVHEEIKGLK